MTDRPGTSMILIAIVTIVESILFGTHPAGATDASYVDPRPCSPTVNDGDCISQLEAAYSTGTVTLSMTVGVATSPVTDPAWFSNQPDYVEWLIARSNDPTASYYAKAADLGSVRWIPY